jgi:hypothetical protein
MIRLAAPLRHAAVPLGLLAGLWAAAPAPAAASACERAGTDAEQAFGLPKGLLLAIGRIESGRHDPGLGRAVAWPWTWNLAGAGQWAETKETAVRLVRDALDRGHRNVDVGCFQVNLMHHPNAFPSLDEAFDPVANARYAARFLVDLKGRSGDWRAAIELYHSANPSRAIPYGRAVMNQWIEAASTGVSAQPVVAHGIRVWTPSPRGAAPSMVTIAMPQRNPATAPDARRPVP